MMVSLIRVLHNKVRAEMQEGEGFKEIYLFWQTDTPFHTQASSQQNKQSKSNKKSK